MRFLVIFFLLCCGVNLNAATYYFSAGSGNDSRSFVDAQNPATPWKTLDKLNAVFGAFQPGDSILFKAGEVFNGSIYISRSGSSNSPIVFSSYGGGAVKPVISALANLNQWISVGNGIWEAAMPAMSSRVNTLLINGSTKEIGRYPNSNTNNKGYLIIESALGNAQITDSKLSATPNWTGGEVVIRKNRWITDRNFITQHSGNSINYISESGYPAPPKFGYFIQNHPSTLDIAGEWYYKAQEKKVGIFSPSQNPSGLSIEASTVENLVSSYNQSYIVFDRLTFRGANSNAFDIGNTQYFRVSNCDILFSGVNAVNAIGTNNVIVENCIINHTNNNGFNGISCSNAVIRNNKIKNTGTVPGMGKGGDGNYEAIVIDGDGETIELNEIDSTGYIPITFRGNDNTIKNNFISNFTLVKDDGGGIYTWNNLPGPVNHGNKVIGNIVLNGVGAGEGTEDPDYLAANGIYMDDGTANAEIIGNTVANCGLQALYIHNGHELKIENNTFFDSRKQMAITRDNFAPNSPVRNVQMFNNILFSKESYQPIAEFWTDFNDIADFGVFDNNYYCRPLDDNSIISVNYNVNGNNNKQLTLEEWRALYGKDISTKKTPIRLPSVDFIRFEYNATGLSKTISLNDEYIDVKNNAYSGSVTLAPFSSIILLKKTGLGDTNVPESTCPGLGSILREQWDNIKGFTVNNIPLANNPNSNSQLALFEAPTNIAEDYGARIRGYICPPTSGNYNFTIASDDESELWLSTDDKPENKVKIAYVRGWTYPREWHKYPSQKSVQINLEAGRKYYIEALHKEGGGGDNIAVAWQLPNGVIEAPIPGNRLSSFTPTGGGTVTPKNNQTISFGSLNSKVYGDAPFVISATASSGLAVSFRIISGPATLSGNTITLTGFGTVEIEASQAGNINFNAAPSVKQSFSVVEVIMPPGCPGTGSILYEQWNNIGGTTLSDISFLQNPPTIKSQLSLFEGPTDAANNYASRIRGYVCPPVSGNYTFWIAGDDASELWLSTDDNPANKVKIAYILSWTNSREWNKFPSQKSVQVYLQSGQRYYIEALHKEGEGGDNLAVAWQLPNGLIQAPIPGNSLLPFVITPVSLTNQTISFLPIASQGFGSAPFTLSATASSGLPVSFRVVSGPATLSGNTVTLSGTGTVEIEASQAGNINYNVAPPVTQSFSVVAVVTPSTCPGTGSILYEQWNNIGSNTLSDISFLQTTPTIKSQLVLFEGPTDVADNYGSRIRGYVCPPLSGNYIFWISGDDASELWLSTDDNPANKVKIAHILSWTGSREWNKFPSQKSVQVYLQSGQRYYIEALHKEGAGGDNLAVAWQLPNGVIETPIPGNRLFPFINNAVNLTNQTISFLPVASQVFGSAPFALSATASSGLAVSFRIVSGLATLSGNTITLTGVGTVVAEASQSGNAVYNAATSVTQSFTVIAAQTPSACIGTGTILYEQWNNISGSDLNNKSFFQLPSSSTGQLTLFEGPTDIADNFASRIRGYICPPLSGNYTFWISGDDASELWLSIDDNPSNKVKIADILSWTNPREWNKLSSQKSVQVYLQSGQRYYVEALHKEAAGGDNLAVAWQLPNGVTEAPIAGNRLLPFVINPVNSSNQTLSFLPVASQVFGSAPFALSAAATSGLPVSFKIISGPATLTGNIITLTGIGTVVVEASQSGNAVYNAATSVTQSFTVASSTDPSTVCSATGSVLHEQWNNVGGSDVKDIPLNAAPAQINQLTALEFGSDIGDKYATRIRGYVCAPQNGNYTFTIAGDDGVELWLSTDDNPANKIKIAYVSGWTEFREWSKFTSQKSSPINLIKGRRYYIEVLHKEDWGRDHVSVKWQLPDGVTEAPIPGTRLSPYPYSNVSAPSAITSITAVTSESLMADIAYDSEGEELPVLKAYPNPFKTEAVIQLNKLEPGLMRLEIIDMKGKLVKCLFDGKVTTDTVKRFIMKSDGLSDGVCVVRLISTTKVISQKIVLLK